MARLFFPPKIVLQVVFVQPGFILSIVPQAPSSGCCWMWGVGEAGPTKLRELLLGITAVSQASSLRGTLRTSFHLLWILETILHPPLAFVTKAL